MSFPFAVAAKSFGKPSETFIRSHAMRLHPGRTAMLAMNDTEDTTFGSETPVLKGLERTGNLNIVPSQVNLSAFIIRHRIKSILAEYGPVGAILARRLMRKLSPKPRLYTHFHGYDASSYLRRPIARKTYDTLFAYGTGYFAPSRFIANKMIDFGCPAQLMTVAPCGVDPQHFNLSNRTHGRCLAVGRMVQKKAPLITIRAFSEAAKEQPELHLDYIGDGELFEQAKALIKELRMQDRITLHGAQPHAKVQELMGNAAFFLQHSVTAENGDCEGLPVAVLEAMCSGIPVLSTRHSGIPEAVLHGEHGLLVDEHDSAGMAAALIELANMPSSKLADMATAARQRIESDFSLDRSLGILREAMELPATPEK